jgi:HNH endonuclease
MSRLQSSVHHVSPLHTLKSGSQTRLQDPMVLCANCHRMIHFKPDLGVKMSATLTPSNSGRPAGLLVRRKELTADTNRPTLDAGAESPTTACSARPSEKSSIRRGSSCHTAHRRPCRSMMPCSVAKWRRRSGEIFAALAAAFRLFSWRSTLKASCSRSSSTGRDGRFDKTGNSFGFGRPRAWLRENPFRAPRLATEAGAKRNLSEDLRGSLRRIGASREKSFAGARIRHPGNSVICSFTWLSQRSLVFFSEITLLPARPCRQQD